MLRFRYHSLPQNRLQFGLYAVFGQTHFGLSASDAPPPSLLASLPSVSLSTREAAWLCVAHFNIQ